MLDDSGNVIVLGNVVFLRPEQVQFFFLKSNFNVSVKKKKKIEFIFNIDCTCSGHDNFTQQLEFIVKKHSIHARAKLGPEIEMMH